MAYDRTQLKLTDQAGDGMAKEWAYFTADTLAVVAGASYFADGYKLGMTVGDRVFVAVVDNANNPTLCTAAGYRVVSSVNATTGAATAGVTPA